MRRIRLRVRSFSGSGIGTADSSACVYGCVGVSNTASTSPISTIRPRYITATRSAMWRTTARSWATNRYDRPSSARSLVEEVDDAGLDRHVEGGDGLVEHDQLRLEGERPGDADALALTPGEVLRVAVGVARLEADEA